MKFFKLYFLIALFLTSAVANAAGITYGEYLSTLKDIPVFEKFRVSDTQFVEKKELQLSKNDKAWVYRTRLREAYKGQPNFARKYVVATIGCGSPCQTNFIIDKESGKIIENFSSSVGVKFEVDSNLLIVNPQEGYEDVPVNEMPIWLGMSFYELKNNKLVLIKEINTDSIKKSE